MKLRRTLSTITSFGLVAGFGCIAMAAIPASNAALPQDQDHKKEHRVVIKKHDSGQDEDVEVIVLQDGDSSHQALLKKLKADHNIDLHNLHSDRGGNVEVVVLQDDDHQAGDHEKLHRHVVDLLHGQNSGKADLHGLAQQLRKIADQLDGKHSASNHKREVHRNVEIHRGGDHDVHIQRHDDSKKSDHRKVEIVTGKRNRSHSDESHRPKEMIFELNHDGDHKLHSSNKNHERIILRSKDQDPHQNVWVEKNQLDEGQKPHRKEMHFGGAKTSDEGHRSVIDELRAELHQLRNEVNQLRSKKSGPQGPKRVIERRKKESSSHNEHDDRKLIWMTESDVKGSGNTFTFKKSKKDAKEASPNRFRFEFKKKDDESSDASDDDN